jgi:DnaJ-like protein/uncharacterized protein DUF4388
VEERNYWVRTEHGRVWGPYTITALERLRGQLSEKCEASVDGKEWLPGADFPELRSLLAPARKIERTAAPTAAPPRISKAMAEAFGIGGTPAPPKTERTAPAQEPQQAPETAPPPPPKRAPPVMQRAPENLDLPDSGDLAKTSPARVYALAALASASGALQIVLEGGKTLRIVFRKGTPEHLSATDPDLSLTRFLQGKSLLTPEKAIAVEEQAAKSGQDLLAVLFQLQLIPPADAHRLLGEHGAFLLDRAMATFRGSFTFDKEAVPPPGAFPLGSRWTLLADSVRRLDASLIRARLGKRLGQPVVRSGGLGIGKVEELGLNAQETRSYASIDGTKSGEDLLRAPDTASATVRLLFLLTELGHLSFVEMDAPAEPPPPPPPPKPETAPAKAAPSAPAARPLPPTVREASRPAAGPAARPAAPPVMKATPPVMHPTSAPKPAAPPKPATPTIARPPPAFAQGPANETPEAMIERLSALRDRLVAADHFETLGLERKSASAAEAKRNFFVLAKELHPDTVTDPAQTELKELKERLFARINEASQVLQDEKLRKEYEKELDGKADNVDVSRIFAAEENFQRAEILIKARKYQEGLELLEQAIQMNAEEAEFYALRGYAKFLLSKDRKQSYEECADDCRKAMKMVDRCLPAHLYLGHMAKITGDQKLARKCYTKVLELDEKHVEAQRELRLMGSKG